MLGNAAWTAEMQGRTQGSPWIMKRVLHTDMVKHITVWKQPERHKEESTTLNNEARPQSALHEPHRTAPIRPAHLQPKAEAGALVLAAACVN